jgi:hypothetical protein
MTLFTGMLKAKILRVLFILVTVLLTSLPAQAAAEEDTSINNETLTGGIVTNEGYYLPKSTRIPVTLRTPIDTRVNNVGDMITAQTTQDLVIGGHVVVPARSFLHGHITELQAPGRFHKAPKLNISFDSLSLPGSTGKRKSVNLFASINAAEVLKKAEAVNDGASYKSKAKKYGAAGAAIGALALHGATRGVPQFQIMGITALSQFGYLAGGAIGGALIASSLITKDDVRMEPGTELVVMVDATTMDNFEEFHPLSQDNLKDLGPEDAYDTFGTIKSEPLADLTDKKKINKASIL